MYPSSFKKILMTYLALFIFTLSTFAQDNLCIKDPVRALKLSNYSHPYDAPYTDVSQVTKLYISKELSAKKENLKLICNFPNLTTLSVSGKTITAKDLAFFRIKTLKTLDLTSTSVSEIPRNSLPVGLEYLYLQFSNGFDYERYQGSFHTYKEGQNIAKHKNSPFGETVFGDCSGISQLKNLKALNLDGLRFKNLSCITNLENIEALHLHMNNLKDSNLEILKQASFKSSLKSLWLDNNRFKDFTILNNFPNLEEVSVRGNKFKKCPFEGEVNKAVAKSCVTNFVKFARGKKLNQIVDYASKLLGSYQRSRFIGNVFKYRSHSIIRLVNKKMQLNQQEVLSNSLRYNKRKIAIEAIQAGADINAQDEQYLMPYVNIYAGSLSLKAVQLAVELGADVGQTDQYGNTPWEFFLQNFKDLSWRDRARCKRIPNQTTTIDGEKYDFVCNYDVEKELYLPMKSLLTN